MTSASSDPQPPQPRPAPRRHLMNLTLWGMPELRLFPSDAHRQRALYEIATESSNVRSGGFWGNVGAFAVVAIGAAFGLRWGLGRVVWPRAAELALGYGGMVLVIYLMLRFLHRRGAAEELRGKLLAVGVPVCRGCGYLLRGLPLDPGRCPECGRDFDADVRRILSSEHKRGMVH